MAENVSFFTPIRYGNRPHLMTESLLEWVDSCFSLGNHQAVVISGPSLNGNQFEVELQYNQPKNTTFKVIAFIVCFAASFWNPLVWCVPGALLVLKGLLRATHSFHWVDRFEEKTKKLAIRERVLEKDDQKIKRREENLNGKAKELDRQAGELERRLLLEAARPTTLCSQENFGALRNDEQSSDVVMVPYQESVSAKPDSSKDSKSDVPQKPRALAISPIVEERIYAHSFLLTEFFKAHARSPLWGGLDETGRRRIIDWNEGSLELPHATAKNIHLFLDYQYTKKLTTELRLDELLSLFSFADYVLADDLKKEILRFLQEMPEARKSVHIVPVIREILLSPTLNDYEFDLLLEWVRYCVSRKVVTLIGVNARVQEAAEKGDVRAMILQGGGSKEGAHTELAALMKKQENPLVQNVIAWYLGAQNLPTYDPVKRDEFLLKAVKNRFPSAIGGSSFLSFYKNEETPAGAAAKAMEQAPEAAHLGSITGTYILGRCLIREPSNPADVSKGYAYLNQAAKMGYWRAQVWLGWCFEKGLGTQQNRKEALRLYLEAAENCQDHTGSISAELQKDIQRVTEAH